MDPAEQAAYDELQAWTQTHADERFVHQHVVDAWRAQHADEQTKPIGLAFALTGLYLRVERGWTGRAVQRAHMIMARTKREWPSFALPGDRGDVTARDAMAAAPGPERDQAIDSWCASVWAAYAGHRATVVALLDEYGIR